MRSSRMKITAVLMTAAFLFAGCGESLYELTQEEEATIVSYAAHTVAKYNTYQQDGEVYVLQEVPKEEEVTTEESEQSSEVQETEQQIGETAGAPSSESQASTLTEALDLGVVQVDYMGSSLCNTYDKSQSYVVDADLGQQLLVLKLNLTNTVAQDLHIDILAMTPTFQAVINGTEKAVAQTTILPDDLSTYQGDILAGATNEAVLLFQIPQEIEQISSIQLKITMNGKNYTVNL